MPVVHEAMSRARLKVGDVVYIRAEYKWYDKFNHVIVWTSPEIGSYNFACKPYVAHAACTLARSRAKVPTCLRCMAAK